MFQAPTTEGKTQAHAAPTALLAPEPERELHPRFAGKTGLSLNGVPGSGDSRNLNSLRQHFSDLQRSIGNRAVLHLLSRSSPTIQTRLNINDPSDQYEEEGDRVAEQITHKPEERSSILSVAPQTLQRKCSCGGICEKCSSENLSTKELLQPKLRLGAADDPYEREADRVADLVTDLNQSEGSGVAHSNTGPMVQRQTLCGGTCPGLTPHEQDLSVERGAISPVAPDRIQREATESCSVKEEAENPEEQKEEQEPTAMEEEAAQKSEEKDRQEQETSVQPKRRSAGPPSIKDVEQQINATRHQGEPLPKKTRELMENRFGYDFSSVRVHNDPHARRLNEDLNALAFTTGHHIYFAPSQFQPGTRAGQHLLAHELTHVVQQVGQGGSGMIRQKADPELVSRAERPEKKWYYAHAVSGEFVHGRLENILRSQDSELVTEAAIPGANRFGPELNKIGIADLYKSQPSKTVTGVKGFNPVEKASDIVAMDSPTAVLREGRMIGGVGTKPAVKSSPKISGPRSGVRRWDGDFPAEIQLGEIKPLSAWKVAEGIYQLDNYELGYKAFVNRINKISGSTRPSISISRLNLHIPPFLNFDNWATQHNTEERSTTVKSRRLWVANIGSGIYAYFDIDKGLTGPPTDWEQQVVKMREVRAALGKNQRTETMDPLASPKSKPGGPKLAPTTPAKTTVIQRSTKDRPANYWSEQGKEWEKKRGEWGKEFRTALKSRYRTYREKLQVEKKLGGKRSAPASEQTEVREYKQLMFWSGLPGRFLGKIRFLLGSAWDKIIGIFEKMKERMHGVRKKISGTSETGFLATGWRKTLIKILVKAAKVAVIKFIGDSFNFFVECFHSAMDKVWEKLQGELHEKFAEELCQARKFFEDSKERLENEWGISLKQLQELVELIQDAKHWVDIATGLIQTIRLGIQAISCLTPPALGCLWGLVAQIGISAGLDLLIGTQWFNDHILSPTIGELVRKYATPYYQKLINRALGDNLKEYHCHIADERPLGSGFEVNDGLKEGSSELIAHRDNWEAQNRDAILRDLQNVFEKGKGKKPTLEELQQLAEELKKSGKSPEELKKLLEAARDPLTGRLKIEVAQDNVKTGEILEKPGATEGEGKERKIDYPTASKLNRQLQLSLGWDPLTFYKKPGVAVDSEEFADAVYDMQEALRIDKDGVLGEQTLIAFYDRNRIKADTAYAKAVKMKDDKQAEREKKDKVTKDKKKGKDTATGQSGDLVAIGIPKPPAGTEVRGRSPWSLATSSWSSGIPFGASTPDIKEGETHAPGELLTVNVRFWVEHQWVWFDGIPVTLRSFSMFNGSRMLEVACGDDFYFKLTADAQVAYVYEKQNRTPIFLDER
jgi:hypothetical protein